jgi:tetratricopeptide (TPR) repeat protein
LDFRKKIAGDDNKLGPKRALTPGRNLPAMTAPDTPRTPGSPAEETAPAVPAAGSGGAEAPAAAPQGSALRRLGWPMLCLFQAGLIFGAYQVGGRLAPEPAPKHSEKSTHQPAVSEPEAPPAHNESPAAPHADSEKPLPPIPGANVMAEADELFVQGRYVQALALYRPTSVKAAGAMRDALQYRVALCLEGLGRLEPAIDAYRALASQASQPEAAAAAQLGQARVWVRLRRAAEGKKLLCDLILRSAQPGLRRHPLFEDAHYLLALALTTNALGSERPGPLNESVIGPLAPDLRLERVLAWAERSKETEPEPPDSGKEEIFVQPLAGAGGDVLVKARVGQTPVATLIDRLAEGGGLKLEWTPLARQQVEERALVVAVENLPLPEVLRALAEPLGLVWTLQGNRLKFSSEEEVPRDVLDAYHAANARRALREVALRFPRHPLAAAAYLELGNLEFGAGHFREAASYYGRLVREHPRAPVLTEAYYNLGLTQRRLGDARAARAEWYKVIDRAPAHDLTPLAYLRIGRLLLEEGEFAEAVSPLRRALLGSSASGAQPAAAINLAVAYLLNGNPAAANGMLLDHRAAILQETYRPAAAFLDSLARYRTGTDRKMLQRDAGDLLTAAQAVIDDPVMGLPGQLLVGQAFLELGLVDQTAALYARNEKELRGPVGDAMALALAEAYLAADRRAEAAPLYGRLAKDGKHGAGQARLRLAEIAMHDNRAGECLKWCRAALAVKGPLDGPTVLRLMAQAYEELARVARREDKRAEALAYEQKVIRCLSGQLPD